MTSNGGVLYVGSYTHHGRARGVFVFDVDAESGQLRLVQELACEDPWFLALSPDHRHLFAVNRGGVEQGGALSVFEVEAGTGRLAPVDRQPVGGVDPCHVCTDPAGRLVVVANHGTGDLVVFHCRPDGHLDPPTQTLRHTAAGGPRPEQGRPRAHFVGFHPNGRVLLACDKGSDTVYLHVLAPDGRSIVPHTSTRLVAGAGPRHAAFDQEGRRVYVTNELDSTVTVFDLDPIATVLHPRQTVSTLPRGFGAKNMTAEIALHPSGRWLYVSNRGHDSIAVFAVGPDGLLEERGHQPTGGRKPRHFAVHPAGHLLYVGNQDSDSIELFTIDVTNGDLSPAGRAAELATPLCLVLSPWR